MKRLLFTLIALVAVATSFAQSAEQAAPDVSKLQKLAEAGDAEAQFNLALFYEDGEGVTQDYAEAVKWWRLAAEQGDAQAQNNLGVCYENGEGVTKDLAEAVKWYRKAAQQGVSQAKVKLNDLGETW